MTTLLDDIVGPIAAELTAEYGVALTVTSPAGVFDTATLSVTSTPTSEILKCAPPYPFKGPLMEGSAVRVGDLVTFVAAQDSAFTFEPKAGMVATFGGKSMAILRVDPVMSGESTAGYTLYMQGGAR